MVTKTAGNGLRRRRRMVSFNIKMGKTQEGRQSGPTIAECRRKEVAIDIVIRVTGEAAV